MLNFFEESDYLRGLLSIFCWYYQNRILQTYYNLCKVSSHIFECVKLLPQLYNLGSTVLLFYLCQTSRSIIIFKRLAHSSGLFTIAFVVKKLKESQPAVSRHKLVRSLWTKNFLTSFAFIMWLPYKSISYTEDLVSCEMMRYVITVQIVTMGHLFLEFPVLQHHGRRFNHIVLSLGDFFLAQVVAWNSFFHCWEIA